MNFMTVRFGTIDGTTALLFALVVAGAWTAMGWTTRILGVDGPGSKALLRTMLALVLVAAVAWLMTGWCAGVSVVVGVWTVVSWILSSLRQLLRPARRALHIPRLFAGECACPRYGSWMDGYYADHRADCCFAPQRTQVEIAERLARGG